jgi:PEP-CTERM motif
MNIKALSVAAAVLVGAATATTFGSNASATTISGLTGPIQTYDPPFGDQHITDVITYLDSLPGISGVVYLGRLDSSGADVKLGGGLSGTGLGGTSGTWTFNPGSTNYVVAFLEINAGSIGKLYDVDPDKNTGFWDTSDITVGGNHPALSHLDFYGLAAGPGGGGTGDIPEPASLALLGAGLVGLGLTRRRKTA